MVIHSDQSLDDYLERARKAKEGVTPQGLAGDKSASWWWVDDADPNYKKYIVSLLKAWYGDHAVPENGFGFNYLPKINKNVNHTHMGIFEAMWQGKVKGMMCWGQNPAVSGPDAEGEREALQNLDWLVVTELFETETATFWKRPGVDPGTVQTEVFVLPAACSFEKEGSITNSGRWAQWRYKALEPPGQAKADLRILDLLVSGLKTLYAQDKKAPHREAVTRLAWDYRTGGAYADAPDPNAVAREVNGYDWGTKAPVTSFAKLKSDGSTCSGNWLYCGMFSSDGSNLAKRRDPVDKSLGHIGLFSDWAWCWPVNRRILYNRASVNLDGAAWSPDKPVIAFDSGAWHGDVPDGPWPPIGMAPVGARYLPFIMLTDGLGHVWAAGQSDGPLPEAYEPWESPLNENLLTGIQKRRNAYKGQPGFNAPCAYVGFLEGMNEKGDVGDYPCVGTTYRVTEQWLGGQMSRNLPWLVELQPEMFVELGVELAGKHQISNGDRVRVSSARGHIEAVAVVTRRFQRLTVGAGDNKKQVDQIGIVWQWGYVGLSKGSSGNVLTPHVGDGNTTIPEYKTFLCKIEKIG